MSAERKWNEIYNSGVNLRQHLGSLYTHSLLLERICSGGKKKILEAGTGSGIMSIFLSLMGHEVTAIDNDQSVLDAAKELNERLGGRTEYILADAMKASKILSGRRFDIAFSQGLLEHFNDEEIKKLLEEQLSVADKVLASVPSVYYPAKDFGNERLLGCGKWRKILSGFDIEELRYYGAFLPGKKMFLSSLFNPAFHFKVAFSLCIRESSHILINLRGKAISS